MDDLFVFSKNGWNPDNRELMLDETLFHSANGSLGVRSAFEEGYPAGYVSIRGQYLNGFYDYVSMPQAEKLFGFVDEKQTMLNVVDTQGIVLKVGDEVFNLFEGKVLEYSRTLDMRAGRSERRSLWRSPKGRTVELAVRRMASFALLPLFTIEYTVRTVDFSGEVTLESGHRGAVGNFSDPNDPRVAAEAFQHILPQAPEWVDGTSVVVSATSRSKLTVASAVRNQLSRPAKVSVSTGADAAFQTFTLTLNQGESVTLTKWTAVCDSVRAVNCRGQALASVSEASSVPLEHWYRKQREYLDDYWAQCSVHVEGDPDLSRAVTYNLYQLLQSVGKDPHANIAAKGLSGEGYEGHYFWDTEIYLLPFFSLNFPALARNLIEFRHTTLDAARENARILGHKKGALFPWRTIMGKECSGYFPSGTAQYHIDADIAYSVIQYHQLTGDLDFLARVGAEILFETARLWMDVGHESGGKFRIHGVTGPDEYTCLVNNNYYTNVMARHNLRWAVRAWKLLEDAGKLAPLAAKLALTAVEVEGFARAAETMLVPYDDERGINPQDDSFLDKPLWDFAGTPKDHYPLLLHYHPLHLYRHQVCKQADTVLAHFLLEDDQDEATVARSFEYYEAVTTHDSSLSTCIFSIVASKLGQTDKAYKYFEETSKLDLLNTHGNTKDGIHAANMGGTYMGIVFGFGGLRLKDDGLHLNPALPAAWSSYDFKVHDRGSRIKVTVDGEGCRLTLEHGPARTLTVYGKQVVLEGALTLARPKR
jgi:alpha,alpha-trehalose phosphorylase